MEPAVSCPRITLNGAHCAITISRPAGRVVLLEISGFDTGDLDRTPFLFLNDLLEQGVPLELFVDARNARGPSVDVSSQWARWFLKNREHVQVNMLTRARGLVRVTAEFVRGFAQLGDRMRVFTESSAFDAALNVASVS